eukprot:7039873-Prorocentrum_lima.AAC.1
MCIRDSFESSDYPSQEEDGQQMNIIKQPCASTTGIGSIGLFVWSTQQREQRQFDRILDDLQY